jgi:hypothetical protein
VSQPYWNVRVAVGEFLRKDRLESELLKKMAAALQAVEGVEAVTQDHAEASYVAGALSGEALVRAAAQVVDRLACGCREPLSRPLIWPRTVVPGPSSWQSDCAGT